MEEGSLVTSHSLNSFIRASYVSDVKCSTSVVNHKQWEENLNLS